MTYYRVMKRININEAKTHLSRYLDLVEKGEVVVLCRRNVPIAELRPLARQPTAPRVLGLRDDFEIPESFFEPLPDELLDAFEGRE